MGRRSVLAVSLLLFGGATASLLDESFADSSSALDVTYSDPTGDASNGAPDVRTIRVGDRNRTVTFTVGVGGIPAPETRVDIYLNVDKNTSTGDEVGREFWLLLDGENLSRSAYRWSGSGWLPWSPSSRRGSYQGGVWTESIHTSDLNGTSSFSFWLYGIRLKDDQNFGFDGTALFTYTLGQQQPPDTTSTSTAPRPPTNRVAITGLTRTPGQPVAGESFTVSATVARVGWPGRFYGLVHCSTLPGVQKRWFGSVERGRASCRWDIPESAVDKTIRGSIGVSEGGGPKVTRRFMAFVSDRAATLSTAGVEMSPAAGPEAGKQFKYALGVSVQLGSGAPRRIKTGAVTCAATAGGKPLKVFEARIRVDVGVQCGWEIPFDAAGKTMAGRIIVRSQGATLNHPLTRRIR